VSSISRLLCVSAAVVALAAPAAAQRSGAKPVQSLGWEETAAVLAEKALKDDLAYEYTRELTTMGPRPAGSDAERRAAEWGAAKFRQLGFTNVAIEDFALTGWDRGVESAVILAPHPQPLAAASLGHAPSTPAAGVEGEVVLFPSMEALNAAPAGSLNGKIAMITRKMTRTQSSAGYGAATGARSAGPHAAAAKGAVAFLIRSVGTDDDRTPHTGTTRYADGRVPIPAFALSNPDADQIERLADLGKPVRVRLNSTARTYETRSQNVIGEVRGRAAPDEIVLIGCHLDSWDLGTGAQDDAAGCGIVTAAAKLIADLPIKPRRTIRVVLFGSEEVAQPTDPQTRGGTDYAVRRAAELPKHIVAGESDLGSDNIYALALPGGFTPEFAAAVTRVMTPLKILVEPQAATNGGVDIGPTVQRGVPVFAFRQDAQRYFDLHHTANDTFDKVDKAQMDQNVAAWSALLWLIADSEARFKGASAEGGH
jgi:Zn-dependent M28 family amino/carboxypeptidase